MNNFIWQLYRYSAITIVVMPPFWKQWCFYAMVSGVTFLLGRFIYRYRINELAKRHAIRNGIAQDLHDHMGSTLSSIAIYSEVAKVYQQQRQTDQLTNVLNIIGTTAAEMIGEMGDIVWAISPENDHLSSIIQRINSFAQPLCAAKEICFQFETDPGLNSARLAMPVRKNVYLILKEAINNAVNHSGCKNLRVVIKRAQDTLNLQICDDGQGFDPQIIIQKNEESLTGNGLKNMKFRVDELNGDCNFYTSPNCGSMIDITFKTF